MFCCDGDITKKFHDEFEVRTQETEKGVKFEVTTKDPKKADAFKQLVKLHKVFCGESCCK